MSETTTALAELVRAALAELVRNPPPAFIDAICARVAERQAADLAAVRCEDYVRPVGENLAGSLGRDRRINERKTGCRR